MEWPTDGYVVTPRPVIPLDAFNASAAALLSIHRDSKVTSYISNLDVEVAALEAGEVLLPVTVNHGDRANAWIASPVTAYCDYAVEEIDRLGHRVATAPLRWFTQGFGFLMRHAGIDNAVCVNNWLVSTNAYPDVSTARIGAIVEQARQRWPDRAIWFRSLNSAHSQGWIDGLRAAGCALIPSRQVYLYADVATLARKRSNARRDLSLLRRSSLRCHAVGELDDADYARIADLYHALYIRKYSGLNPQYRANLLKAWHIAGLLEMQGMRDARGVLQAIVGTLRFGDLITCPIVGYDTQLPLQLGLYRMLMAAVLRQAMENDCLINLSAGAAHFKTQRGGQPAIEYNAVLANHLPRSPRATLNALRQIAQRVGVPIMEHYKL
ncbi:MAG TPA: hypothetical protein VK660_07670 [Xanthomonadaceae bacterium]|jgi:hypothetical protein|nr:hypothetical protein [Xanthomonadaceae bacterium]